MVGGDEAELVLVGDLIARIIAQTCRQSGLSVVYTELLDFGGDEIYFRAEPALVGKTFGDALLAYEDSAVIGLCPAGGAPQLNPPLDTPHRGRRPTDRHRRGRRHDPPGGPRRAAHPGRRASSRPARPSRPPNAR